MNTKSHLAIYLAGKVAKGSEIGNIPDWRQTYVDLLRRVGTFEFLSPDDFTADESRPELVFGHDCYLVSRCDMVLVNADTKLGVGTAQEMVIAKYYGKHVFTVLPRNSHHRRLDLQIHGYVVSDWVHPFLACMSDAIFSSLHELCDHIQRQGNALLTSPARTLSCVDEAISAYLALNQHQPIRT